jgi:MFS family permease
MVSSSTILPLLVSDLTGSKLAVGLVGVIFNVGFLLPQLLTAGYSEGLRRKKPFIVLYSALGERLPWLITGLLIGFFAESTPWIALAAIYLGLAVTSATSGILMPAWFDMIAKVIPLRKRGIWFGLGNGLGALMGIAGAAIAGRLLASLPFPQNYAMCFLLAFLFTSVSWMGLALNREPDSPSIRTHSSFLGYIRQLPAVIRRDRNYQSYLISRSISNLGGMAAGFFIVYGAERFGLNGAQVGGLTAVYVGIQALINLAWGYIGDRKGHKLVLVWSTAAMGLALLAALLVASPLVLWALFILLGVAVAGDNTSGLNIILEFCGDEERPTYIGLTNTLLAPSRAIAPLLGGWLATLLGFSPMFAVALVATIVGCLMLELLVREPRHIKRAVGET